MGQRTASETVIAIVVAFFRQSTWSQADLAREIGVAPRTVRKHLEELEESGWPLDRDEDHPQVYWSLPNGWFPGGILLEPASVAALLHVLVRVPASSERERLMNAIAEKAPKLLAEELHRIVPPRSSAVEGELLPAVLDATARRAPLRLRYFTASRGALSFRTVSVQRVLVGPPTRFLAWCHARAGLRWFRLDYATSATIDASAEFHEVDDAEVDAMVEASVDGFHAHAPSRVEIFVREPEARWVAGNLPDGLTGTSVEGGFLIEAESAGLLPIARFVVGLGEAAEVRTPELRALVRELAEGALRQVARLSS